MSMTAIAKNNAFGAGSPSWNLSFPDGNLTASEILAYLPHWLKSVDVILRLASHGGRSVTITHLLDKYRIMRTGDYKPNSTTVMMRYAMRRAGFEDWTIGTRDQFETDREYDPNSLYVGDFRPPRLTHPKSAATKQKFKRERLARNWAADPVPFKDLALHVKEHPSGDDALDLTRCVGYALKHPTEKWLFPDDFVKLVKHLGGPAPVTHSHLDNQLFARYDHLYVAHVAARDPAKYKKRPSSKRKRKSDIDLDGDTDNGTDIDSDTDLKGESGTETRSRHKPNKASQKGRAKKTKSVTKVTRRAQDGVMAAQVDGSHDTAGGKRRSSRRVKKAPVYAEKDGDDTDVETVDADHASPHRKRKLSRIPHTPKEEESDFEAKEEPEPDDDMLSAVDEMADDFDFGTPTAARGKRLASRKARQHIQEQSPAILMEQFRAAAATAKPAHRSSMDHSPEMMAAARAYATRMLAFLPPPVLSANRMIIDPYTVVLYAQEGCRNEAELWASALSTYRFGGPRRHAPFRELYRLTEPLEWDTSDWAENIRWAKQQYRYFGVTTWTEYDDHLQSITDWRMQSLWVSEEAIRAPF